MNPAKKLISSLQEEGIKGFLVKVFRKLIYRKQTIVLLNQDLNHPRRKFKSSKRWEVRQFTEEDLTLCRGHFRQYINDYKDLFSEKYIAFAAFETESQEAIAVAWYAPRDFYDQHYHRYTFSVAEHQVFQFAGEVAPDFRNTQVSVNVMHVGWDYWKEQGKQEVMCTIDALNAPSLRLMFHLEWEEAGSLIHFHRLFGKEWQTIEQYEGERFEAFKKKHKRRAKE